MRSSTPSCSRDRTGHWSGTAAGRLTKQTLNNPQPAIDAAVAAIFAKYPKQPLVANTNAK